MFKKFTPFAYYRCLEEIDFSRFRRYSVLIFDYDNTLTSWSGQIDSVIQKKIKQLSAFHRLLVFSNGDQARVAKACQNLEVSAFGNCYKPTLARAKQILHELDIEPQDCVFIGDNLITDIWFANRLQMKTVLLDPRQKQEFVLTGFWRFCEKIVKPFIKLGKQK